MTFAAFETAQETGRPVELYEFLMGGEFFRFTSDQNDYTAAGNTFIRENVSRSQLRVLPGGGQRDGEKLEVVLPAENGLVKKFVLVVPGKKPLMTLYRVHRNDPDQQLVTLFKGQVQSVSFTQNGRQATMQIAPLTVANSRPMPRHTYQNLCNHMLYDARCKILETDVTFRKFLPVTAASGSTITATGAGAFGSDFFLAGFVEFQADFRLIVGQATDVLTLNLPFGVSPVGQTLRFQAGCKHRLVTDCQTKFNNVVNFGGFPFVPTKNPFETGLD